MSGFQFNLKRNIKKLSIGNIQEIFFIKQYKLLLLNTTHQLFSRNKVVTDINFKRYNFNDVNE